MGSRQIDLIDPALIRNSGHPVFPGETGRIRSFFRSRPDPRHRKHSDKQNQNHHFFQNSHTFIPPAFSTERPATFTVLCRNGTAIFSVISRISSDPFRSSSVKSEDHNQYALKHSFLNIIIYVTRPIKPAKEMQFCGFYCENNYLFLNIFESGRIALPCRGCARAFLRDSPSGNGTRSCKRCRGFPLPQTPPL